MRAEKFINNMKEIEHDCRLSGTNVKLQLTVDGVSVAKIDPDSESVYRDINGNICIDFPLFTENK